MVINDQPLREPDMPNTSIDRYLCESAEDTAFWEDYSKSYTYPLLDYAHYTEAERESYRQYTRKYVIPAQGGKPRPEVVKPRMCIAPHGGPFDNSINFTQKRAVARVGFAVNGPKSFTPEDPLGAETSYAGLARFAEDKDSGVDLTWLDSLMPLLYPKPSEVEDDLMNNTSVYKTYATRVAFAAAVDFDGPKVNLKAYLSPFVQHAITGKSEDDITFSALKSMAAAEGLQPCVKLMESYLATRMEPFLLRSAFLGIDCADPATARVKLYTVTNTTRFDHVRAAMTLSGKMSDESQGIGILRQIWHLLLDEPEGIEVDNYEKPFNPASKLPGAFISYEIRAGQALPDTKVYIPMASYHRSDEAAARNLDRIFAIMRDQSIMGKWAWNADIGVGWPEFFEKHFGSGGLPGPEFCHSWTTFSFTEKKGVYMTAYTAKNVQYPLMP